MNKKYSVQVRMKNPGVTKYLMESSDHDSFMSAFYYAQKQVDRISSDYFIEIRDAESNEKMASFNERS